MTTGSADEKVLSYNDVVLRRSDLDILSGPFFLNDRIIEFYFSYLTSCHPSEDILLVPPSITFWIKECPDTESLKEFVEPLHLSQRKLIIFPINDNADVTMAEGGSHWSLLAYEKNANLFVHHDSSQGGGVNGSHAKRVYRSVTCFVASDATYVECFDSPKQVNGYDCGLYVTAIARAICEWFACGRPKDEQKLWFTSIKEQVTPSLVSKMRSDILELIRSLMATP
ncbi:NEDD8-specific protease 1 [Andrographis paniculata]|uniref:NEDD8-specific protease 1 n=1 Tax=Andrographis paniculata TaxID=175694 RepID=UPI0021E8175F|nr:NEDD8-specific protease 1 [Andrographis paniculata]XP_051126700.1 NEDD8-specific protease 1 [Andrographis paniculata]